MVDGKIPAAEPNLGFFVLAKEQALRYVQEGLSGEIK